MQSGRGKLTERGVSCVAWRVRRSRVVNCPMIVSNLETACERTSRIHHLVFELFYPESGTLDFEKDAIIRSSICVVVMRTRDAPYT